MSSVLSRKKTALVNRHGLVLMIALIALAGAAKTIICDTIDPDSFWHLRVGEQLLNDGIGPLNDSISYSSIREPWTPYSWLCEIGMLKLWQFGGFRLAIAATAMCVAGFIVMMAFSCIELQKYAMDNGPAEALRDRQFQFSVVLATAFGTFLSLPFLSFRPVTFCLFILSICFSLIVRDRRILEKTKSVWLTIPLAAFLINIHLFAVLIPIWFFALLLGATWERIFNGDPEWMHEFNRSIKRYGIMFLMSALACCLTPMLPGLLLAVGHYTLHDPMVASTVIGEMRPFYSGGMGKISLALVLYFALCMLQNQRRMRLGEIIILLISAAFLLWKGRMSPVFAIAAAPAFSVVMPRLHDRVLAKRPVQVCMLLVLSMGIFRTAEAFPNSKTQFSAWLNRNGADCPGYPTKSAEFVSNRIEKRTGRIINEFNWGGYLAWELKSDFKVLLDGRTQVFAPQFWSDVYLNDGDQRRKVLAESGADVAIVPIDKSRFRATLVQMGWKSIHRDDRAEVLVPAERFVGMDVD